MDLYDLEHYLFRLKNEPALQAGLVAEPEAQLRALGIEGDARDAILAKDVAALWRLGVHPLLLVPLSRTLGMRPEAYRAALRPLAGQRPFKS